VRRRLEFSAVIVPKLARFRRSMKDLVETLRVLVGLRPSEAGVVEIGGRVSAGSSPL
jgi:hypothetical protein